MLIRIGGFDFTEVWDGVLYKNLSNFPEITPWEKRLVRAENSKIKGTVALKKA